MTEKPCRVCGDFRSWMHKTASEPVASKPSADSSPAITSPSASARPPPTPPSPPPTQASSPPPSPVDTRSHLPCPPDSQELGSATWTFLHTMASYYPDTPSSSDQQAASSLLHALGSLYPCSYCAKHLRSELRDRPPQVQNREKLEQWLCELHNEVNERLGKPYFDCLRVRERWRDGPSDGSCD